MVHAKSGQDSESGGRHQDQTGSQSLRCTSLLIRMHGHQQLSNGHAMHENQHQI